MIRDVELKMMIDQLDRKDPFLQRTLHRLERRPERIDIEKKRLWNYCRRQGINLFDPPLFPYRPSPQDLNLKGASIGELKLTGQNVTWPDDEVHLSGELLGMPNSGKSNVSLVVARHRIVTRQATIIISRKRDYEPLIMGGHDNVIIFPF